MWSRAVQLLPLLFFAATTAQANTKDDDDSGSNAMWQWLCNQTSDSCEKMARNNHNSPQARRNLATCRLTCGKFGALWPKPTENCTLSKDLIQIDVDSIFFHVIKGDGEASELVSRYSQIFVQNLRSECAGEKCDSVPDGPKLMVYVSMSSSSLAHHWDTNEHYSLDVSTSDNVVSAYVKGENYFGVRNGLETLSQLFAAEDARLVMLQQARISDKPAFRHRGLLLDTARNYIRVRALMTQIRAMAASKLNVLHWHATDSQSFPLSLPDVPELARYGAYANGSKVYTDQDLTMIVDYARLHGIRVVFEIDAPAHAGNGWQYGPVSGLGELAVCVNLQPWRQFCVQPPCGQLNPANERVYEILGRLYADLVRLMPRGEVFHMGGDEVFYNCWNSSKVVTDFMAGQGWGTSLDDFLKLWALFQERALAEFDKTVGDSKTPIVLWSSDLTEPEVIEKFLDKSRYIVQTWVPATSTLPETLISKGYRLIISTKDAWYLDHGFWGSTTYHNWQVVYNNRLLQHQSVLGGEVCMWGELVDETGLEPKVWPRAAAAAERLWSNPSGDSSRATKRFYRHRERLVARRINADALAPRWCYQNEGECL